MYSRKRGKAGSTKPSRKTKPTWVERTDREILTLITKFKKEGKTNSQIGMLLRDLYGVPDVKVATGKKITQILKEKKLESDIPEDLLALIKKYIIVKKHLEENRHDMPAKRGMQLTESKIRRLMKYYKKIRKLPLDWKFDEKTIKLYV
jgi:small subunit ribosomal protein S15